MPRGVSAGTKVIQFAESLEVPQGKLAGQKLKLADFQKRFLRGALKADTRLAILCVGRGNGKTSLSAVLALAHLLGVDDDQRSRDVIFCARNRDQARIGWTLAMQLCRSLPDDIQSRLKFRRSPVLEIEFDEEHVIRAIPADGRSILGSAPTLAILDERGFWDRERGDELENAILSGLGKRSGRAVMISTSAPDDSHPFSRWIDAPPEKTFIMEFRPESGLPPDDLASLKLANPGAVAGIGSSLEWLQAQARQAIQRGGSSLASFRLLNRNERCTVETRACLITLDEWLKCEVADLPPRSGFCVIGLDLGESASMTASAFYWPETGRLEAHGWFPSNPSLLERGQIDAVSDRYVRMRERGELSLIGDRTVPVDMWLAETLRLVEGETIHAILCDRYKQRVFEEAVAKLGIRSPVIFRGFGFKDGSEDVQRFRRAVFDGEVKSVESLLLRSAFGDAVCKVDDAGNTKIVKARSLGRIDAASASTIAVAEGVRLKSRPAPRPARLFWA